jgi:hypothetical protein
MSGDDLLDHILAAFIIAQSTKRKVKQRKAQGTGHKAKSPALLFRDTSFFGIGSLSA